jgi:two-component system cell cycle response regulator DivK
MPSKILYIEDNPLNMRLVRKFLVDMGYEMIEAMDGQSGLSMIAAQMPNLILVDVNLPDIDGLQVARLTKNNPATAHIPIVALTANAMHGDRERCLEAGCDGYIAKPVARLELRNVLNHFLATNPLTVKSG